MTKKLVPAADKTIKIIEYLVENSNSSRKVSEIANDLSYSKGTVHSILQTLIENQWIEKDPITNKYYLSNRLFTLSQNWEQDNKLTSDFMRIGNTIEHQCNELINLHLPHSIDSSILTARILPSNRNLRVDYPIGATFSAVQSSAGKCLICEQDDLLLKRIFEYHHSNTPSLNQDCNNFITEIHKIQQMGYAFNLEEVEKGVCSIGAPIRNAKGSIIAALNIVVPQIRFTEERIKTLISLATDGANKLSQLRGWSPPSNIQEKSQSAGFYH